ncbi:hypothetical protein NYA22BAC_00264 [Parasphingorhabdus sp. NYA22]
MSVLTRFPSSSIRMSELDPSRLIRADSCGGADRGEEIVRMFVLSRSCAAAGLDVAKCSLSADA